MKYLKQFLIIITISFIGEVLKELLPFPVPASIYGMLIMFIALCTGVIELSKVSNTGDFLIEIMPVMFIPAGAGLLDSWGVLKPVLLPISVITVISTVIVMAVSGRVTQFVARREKKVIGDNMNNFLSNSVFFGVFLSLAGYGIGLFIKKKLKLALFNPLLIAIVIVIAVLKVTDISYSSYNEGAKYISYLLTPATVCLSIPLYRQIAILKNDFKAIAAGIVSGVLSSMGSVLAMSVLFGLTHEQYVTLLPKSITTAIGMGVSEELGGIVTITVAIIIITGVIGNIIASPVCRLLHITEPVAIGISIGSSAHAVGTARAFEIGETEGAMSSLSIAVSGLVTVIIASVFAGFY